MKKIKRTGILSMCSFALLPFHSSGADKPNVIVILADDMGYGDVGFNGCPDIPTPHIDSIAKNGARFSEGYVTAPQCGPSRSGLITGISQSRFGMEDNFVIEKEGLPLDLKTIGNYMTEAGYRAGAIGKWHLGDEEGYHPLDRGFEYFYGFLPGSSHYYPRENQSFLPNIQENREARQVKKYLTSVLGEQAVKFVQQKSDRPFFLYLAHYAPHGPLQAPDEYVKRFEHLAESGGTTCRYAREFIPNARQIYAAMVSVLDDTVGDLLKALRERGLEENTLIFFLSDNGGQTDGTTACNGPFRGQKGDVLEGGLRVPFAVQWKGTIPAGQTLDAPVSSLDLLPTSLAAAGASVPKTLDGMNLLPLLIDGEKMSSRSILCRFPFPPWQRRTWWMIRQGDMKLVHEASRGPRGLGFTGKEGKTGLYRVSDDPGEAEDLSAKYPEVRQELQKAYDAWNATLPPENWIEPPSVKR